MPSSLLKLTALLAFIAVSLAQGFTSLPDQPTTSAENKDCVPKAIASCNKRITPPGHPWRLCLSVSDTLWTDPLAGMRAKCFCDRKEISVFWWNCFYPAVALCVRDEGSMREVWEQEWSVHRQKRRLYCVDDWKPNPQLGKLDNEFFKMHYNTGKAYQYSYDYAFYRKRGIEGGEGNGAEAGGLQTDGTEANGTEWESLK